MGVCFQFFKITTNSLTSEMIIINKVSIMGLRMNVSAARTVYLKAVPVKLNDESDAMCLHGMLLIFL